jgi:hypothetical protein
MSLSYIYWYPLGESNPCFRRERQENGTFWYFLKHLTY